MRGKRHGGTGREDQKEGDLGLTRASAANKESPICSEAAADCREGRGERRYMSAPMQMR